VHAIAGLTWIHPLLQSITNGMFAGGGQSAPPRPLRGGVRRLCDEKARWRRRNTWCGTGHRPPIRVRPVQAIRFVASLQKLPSFRLHWSQSSARSLYSSAASGCPFDVESRVCIVTLPLSGALRPPDTGVASCGLRYC